VTVAPVLPSAAAISAVRPLSASDVRLTPGFWASRIDRNRTVTLGHGSEQLRRAGNLENLRLAAHSAAARPAVGMYRSLGESIGLVYPFLDSDVYKWLEAAGWELGRARDEALAASADEAIAVVEAAQRPDGYINSYVQVVARDREYVDLQWGHELYCVGHLIQAAIAWHRALRDDRLLTVAIAAADSVERTFGPAGRHATDGHPEIEMALVELFRTTGERRYLELARRLIEARGRGVLGAGRFGSAYWQDHLPVREAPTVAGHAVRQLYLDCGAVDVATELGDRDLLEAVRRRWLDMVATRSYVTGGLGSRHEDESFGDPFELPPDRAYAETCAAVASVMLAWRLLLATGDPDCADVIERAVYNAVLPGVSLDGERFFYVNALQRRSRRAAAEPAEGERASWFPCACCPPNLMRLLSSWEQYLSTADDDGIRIWQYTSGELGAEVAGEHVRLKVETDYPWDGEIEVTVLHAPERPFELSLRIPGWVRSAQLRGVDGATRPVDGGARDVREHRRWRSGDALRLTLEMPARVTEPDPRADAIRSCIALERGPLVYCIEAVDVPAGVALEDVRFPPGAAATPAPRPDVAADIVGLSVAAEDAQGRPLQVEPIPYFAWANRAVEAMRVWVPVSGAPGQSTRERSATARRP
jgi:uncharacterized protein